MVLLMFDKCAIENTCFGESLNDNHKCHAVTFVLRQSAVKMNSTFNALFMVRY